MRLIPLAIATLILLPLLAVAPVASAWPPACMVREAEVGPAEAKVWFNCGVGASATACPTDRVCRTLSTDPENEPEAVFLPPVCLQKSASAARTTVTAQVTCEVWAEVTHCPPVGQGPCWALLVGPLP